MTKKSAHGFGLVEVLLAMGIFSLVVTGLLGALSLSRNGVTNTNNREQALYLAEEGFIALYNSRDIDARRYFQVGTFGVDYSNQTLLLAPSPDVVGIYTRTIATQKNKYGSLDVVVTVEWLDAQGVRNKVSLDGLVSNWRRPI